MPVTGQPLALSGAGRAGPEHRLQPRVRSGPGYAALVTRTGPIPAVGASLCSWLPTSPTYQHSRAPRTPGRVVDPVAAPRAPAEDLGSTRAGRTGWLARWAKLTGQSSLDRPLGNPSGRNRSDSSRTPGRGDRTRRGAGRRNRHGSMQMVVARPRLPNCPQCPDALSARAQPRSGASATGIGWRCGALLDFRMRRCPPQGLAAFWALARGYVKDPASMSRTTRRSSTRMAAALP